MAFEINVQARGTHDFTVPITTASGGFLQLGASDVVRCKVQRGSTEVLDIDSETATANGSLVTIDELGDGSATNASVTVRFAQEDLTALAGGYTVIIGVVDDSETAPADAFKVAEAGLLTVSVPAVTGDVGK